MSKSEKSESKGEEKRKINPLLRKILEADVKISNKLVSWTHNIVPIKSLKVHYQMLEVSCHGILWLSFWIAFTWLFNDPAWYQSQVNMLLGLVLDIIIVAIVKASTRRRRPSPNTDPLSMGPDKYSFPSGHASRAWFVVGFFMWLHPLPLLFRPPLLAWAVSICVTRVLMSRHHLLDVLAGVVLGLLEAALLSVLWLQEDTAVWIISFITDDKIEGGDYHV